MTLQLKSKFGKKEDVLSGFANALRHPGRIVILKEVAKRKHCNCMDIVEVLPLAQSTVSRHLHELVKAGLLDFKAQSAKSWYSINWKTFEKFEYASGDLFKVMNSRHANDQKLGDNRYLA